MTSYDLFTYPHRAGFKESTTSREAAAAIEATGRAGTLRDRVAAWFASGRVGTADECAEALDEAPFSVRPRCAELKARGVIVETGERRQSAGGRMAHVWRAA